MDFLKQTAERILTLFPLNNIIIFESMPDFADNTRAVFDALLTEYSSVFYDYLLCGRPIGLCWEDFEEYNRNVGFTVDIDEALEGCERLYTVDALCAFIADVARGTRPSAGRTCRQ